MTDAMIDVENLERTLELLNLLTHQTSGKAQGKLSRAADYIETQLDAAVDAVHSGVAFVACEVCGINCVCFTEHVDPNFWHVLNTRPPLSDLDSF